MTRQSLGLLTLLSLAGGAAIWTTFGGRWADIAPGPAVLDAPLVVEVPPTESGAVAEFRFRLANRGGSRLDLDQFRTDCACNSLDRESADGHAPLDRVGLEPGEEVWVRFRKTVRGGAGASLQSVVYCRTTDPDRPEAAVHVRVPCILAGVAASPPHWIVGAVPQFGLATQVFTISDSASPARVVERIEASDPNRFTATYEPCPTPGGTGPTGRIVVRVLSDVPGPFDGTIKLHVVGGKADPEPIRISGRVVTPVECTPAALVLPRMSSEGALYHAVCIVRSSSGQAMTLVADSVPEGVAAEVRSDYAAPAHAVTIKVVGGKHARSEKVRLTANVGGKVVPVEIALRVVSFEEK